MHRPPSAQPGRPDPSKLSGVHRKVRRVKKPGWNDTQHDLDEFKPSAQELLERKLRTMSKEQLMRMAGIEPPQPQTQQTAVSQHKAAEAVVYSNGEDKENVKPNQGNATLRTSRPLKPAVPAEAAHPIAHAALPPHGAVSRVSVQPVVTAPVAAMPPAAAVQVLTPTSQQQKLPPGYRTVLRAASALSPVLERSIEVELDAEAHADRSGDLQQHVPQLPVEDEETQQLIARIDTLTAAASASPMHVASPASATSTPERSAPPMDVDVAARMQQLANTPTLLPTTTTTTPPHTTPPHHPHPATPPHHPAAAASPSIQHRLFLLLRQVATHLESLSERQAAEATGRAALQRAVEAKEREAGLLQAKVAGLEGGMALLQKQLLSMQRGYDEQLSNMVNAITQLEHRDTTAQYGTSTAAQPLTQPPSTQAEGYSAKRTFAVPPPFVSSQQRTSEQPHHQRTSPSPRRHRTETTAAEFTSPPRAPHAFSPHRPASSASFLASPSPPRVGRSPQRTVARWQEVSRLEERLQATIVHSSRARQIGDTHDDEAAKSMLEDEAGRRYEVAEPDVSQGGASTFSVVPAVSLSSSSTSNGRRSAGWPQHASGWTVHK